MSEVQNAAPQNPIRAQRRLDVFLSSRRNRVFGIAEIVAVSVSCLVFLLVVFSYLYFLVPARSRRESLRADRTQLETNLKKSEGIVSKGQGIQQTVDKIAASLDRFEHTGLVTVDQGRMDLYEDINRMIIKNALRNTSGPTYTTLEPLGTRMMGKSTSTRWQSVFPGISVDVTVEGPYQNVRKFISDIENSRQFLIINQVELQRATQNNAPTDVSAEAGSGSRVSLVSLQLNLATYFQRTEADQN